MPGITDTRSSIGAVARAAAAADASFFAAGALFLKPCSQPTFLSFVQEHFPGQFEAYKRRYATSAFVSAEYRKRVAALVDSLCFEYKLGRRYAALPEAGETAGENPQLVESQPWLPFQ
jgi:hypothetical protein